MTQSYFAEMSNCKDKWCETSAYPPSTQKGPLPGNYTVDNLPGCTHTSITALRCLQIESQPLLCQMTSSHPMGQGKRKWLPPLNNVKKMRSRTQREERMDDGESQEEVITGLGERMGSSWTPAPSTGIEGEREWGREERGEVVVTVIDTEGSA